MEISAALCIAQVSFIIRHSGGDCGAGADLLLLILPSLLLLLLLLLALRRRGPLPRVSKGNDDLPS